MLYLRTFESFENNSKYYQFIPKGMKINRRYGNISDDEFNKIKDIFDNAISLNKPVPAEIKKDSRCGVMVDVDRFMFDITKYSDNSFSIECTSSESIQNAACFYLINSFDNLLKIISDIDNKRVNPEKEELISFTKDDIELLGDMFVSIGDKWRLKEIQDNWNVSMSDKKNSYTFYTFGGHSPSLGKQTVTQLSIDISMKYGEEIQSDIDSFINRINSIGFKGISYTNTKETQIKIEIIKL